VRLVGVNGDAAHQTGTAKSGDRALYKDQYGGAAAGMPAALLASGRDGSRQKRREVQTPFVARDSGQTRSDPACFAARSRPLFDQPAADTRGCLPICA